MLSVLVIINFLSRNITIVRLEVCYKQGFLNLCAQITCMLEITCQCGKSGLFSNLNKL